MKSKGNNLSLSIFGLIAGLATGAVFGVLFAPRKGRYTRDLFTGKLIALCNNAKISEPKPIKDHAVEDLRSHHQQVADRLADIDHQHELTALKQTGPKSRQIQVENQ